MKTTLQHTPSELHESRGHTPEFKVQQLIYLEETISSSITQFEQSVTPSQVDNWESLKSQVNHLRRMAQQSKLRVLQEGENLPAGADEMRDLINALDEKTAAIEVGRNEHKARGISDVFKALFMWRESPEEHFRVHHG